ncbi:FMN reductase [Agrococcus sp. ARC_14]|uniref:FMN reductase n=1 Tax=Agrococcus sp. ARC_14 TaxID=2919927 RepID=UPI001F05A83E|nr:FMN reductase [Agrococcus sp. ARC_14]MCH1882597.1 FMN reductase [Agrococcus sp. ARC_14]
MTHHRSLSPERLRLGRHAAPDEPVERLRIVAVSGSLHRPSSTTALVAALADAIALRTDAEIQVIELAEVGPHLAGALERSALPPEAELAIEAIEEADLLVVGSPVYRASFTGLFKHLFDFVDQRALVDTPVLLAATGGSHRHALTIEHQLRPLFAFFQALTLPVGVYAASEDFDAGVLRDPGVLERVEAAADRALPYLVHRPAPVRPAVF